MLYGVISDIHGNLEAAIAVNDFLHKNRIEKLLVLGDVVGYGVNPEECIELFESFQTVFIKGNHEEAVITGNYDMFTTDARISIEWTEGHLSRFARETISGWKTTVELEDFVICHGGLVAPLYFYTNSRSKAKRIFDEFEFKICFIGHTHFPMAFSISDGQKLPAIIAQRPDGRMRIFLEGDKRYIINTGSVGQPRDGNPNACCAIFDTESRIFELHRISYPVEITAKKILDAGLPSSLAARISRGL
ncbi:MAG: metallophosphatase family protein [Candidatus Omnitrophica bacterium]|nr:metallophosphatase family protein [Candidatus Omnitrophota bacterium]MCM8827954.1 metallophosphatase family protein [Candidatus Omnitrophota bacterium]